jgi:hypothetical protein
VTVSDDVRAGIYRSCAGPRASVRPCMTRLRLQCARVDRRQPGSAGRNNVTRDVAVCVRMNAFHLIRILVTLTII